ncbi:unnamed protein product, partial [Prorocentrum cordatum]
MHVCLRQSLYQCSLRSRRVAEILLSPRRSPGAHITAQLPVHRSAHVWGACWPPERAGPACGTSSRLYLSTAEEQKAVRGAKAGRVGSEGLQACLLLPLRVCEPAPLSCRLQARLTSRCALREARRTSRSLAPP